MIVKIFLINAFIDDLFSGGQAMVVILRRLGQTHALQALARELKAPVTACVLPYKEGFAVRYFSKAGELDSGGYAALATAKALYYVGLAPPDQPIRLSGVKGPVQVRPPSGLDSGLSLILPPAPAQWPSPDWAQGLSESLGQAAVLGFLDGGSHRLICLDKKPEEILPAAITALAIPNQLIISWPQGEDGYGLRGFGPAGEEAELPVNLDFHAALGSFWSGRLGRNRLRVHHLALRPALMRVEVTAEAVELSGRLQIIFKAVPAFSEPEHQAI